MRQPTWLPAGIHIGNGTPFGVFFVWCAFKFFEPSQELFVKFRGRSAVWLSFWRKPKPKPKKLLPTTGCGAVGSAYGWGP